MDGYDIYRKLVFGTSFDFSKNKKRKRKPKKLKAEENEIEDNLMHLNSQPKIEENILKNSTAYDEDDDITLIDGEHEESPKKKKQKTMSLMKLTKIKQEEIRHTRKKHHIYIQGEDVSDLFENFADLTNTFGLHPFILRNICTLGYTVPTPIQMQVIPLMMEDRQVMACAPTGSGKTAAFLIPVLHKLRGPQNVGYRALVLAPTRELAKQIHQDCLRLAEGTNIRPHIIDKVKNVVKKPKITTKYDILISTPNRLIYMLQDDPPLINLDKIQWFIVDESDKLFEAGKQGFRDQLATVYKACDSAHVKRAMFSATFSHDVEEWCKLNLDSVVSVTVGVRNSAADTVKQELVFVGCDYGKLLEFRYMVQKGLMPPVLVFVQTKARACELYNELAYDGLKVDVIHADRTQLERDNVVHSFRTRKIWILICTELMARGIDFKGVNIVINYDFPPSTISYIHRIGRTGRAGRPGRAITYFTEDDKDNLRSIAQIIKNSGGEVPEYILDMPKKKKGDFSKKDSLPENRKDFSLKGKRFAEKGKGFLEKGISKKKAKNPVLKHSKEVESKKKQFRNMKKRMQRKRKKLREKV